MSDRLVVRVFDLNENPHPVFGTGFHYDIVVTDENGLEAQVAEQAEYLVGPFDSAEAAFAAAEAFIEDALTNHQQQEAA